LTGAIKEMVDHDIRMYCEWKGCEVEELNVQTDHVHLVVSIPPKISVSYMMGLLKGKTAIKLFSRFPELKKKPYWGNRFWARGYFVDTVGINKEQIVRYVKYQEKEEKLEEKNTQNYKLF
jgi:putative transposase